MDNEQLLAERAVNSTTLPDPWEYGAQQLMPGELCSCIRARAGRRKPVWYGSGPGMTQSREIKVGLTDGASTEVVEGDLTEGEMVITGQNLPGAKTASSSQWMLGFGNAPRTPGGGGGPRR